MSDDEEYRSSEDEEYVPTDGEEVSEEEHSGDEENLDALKEDGEPTTLGKRKRKVSKKSPKKGSGPRKRTGGIMLEGDTTEAKIESDGKNKELEEQIKLEQVQKKEEQEKKRADDLWSSFMSDVGKPPPKKPATASSGLGSLTSLRKVSTPNTKSTCTPISTPDKPTPASSQPQSQSKITVTKVYDFAGEAVKVTKELDVNSKEGQAELKRQKEEAETQSDSPVVKPSPLGAGKHIKEKQCPNSNGKCPNSNGYILDKLLLSNRLFKMFMSFPVKLQDIHVSGIKRTSGGLGGVLDKINKKPKMGTLEKSKHDWEQFKEKEGIDEELKIHNRGKESYIERMQFLQRTDLRQFEIEKNLRLSTSSKR